MISSNPSGEQKVNDYISDWGKKYTFKLISRYSYYLLRAPYLLVVNRFIQALKDIL